MVRNHRKWHACVNPPRGGRCNPGPSWECAACLAVPRAWRIPGEEWRPAAVPGHDQYLVSNLGRVKHRSLNHAPLNPKPMSDGYRRLCFTLPGATVMQRVAYHHLVAEAFIGPRPEGLVVNHKDLNKLNNAVENLEYVTMRDNIHHAAALGRGALAKLYSPAIEPSREKP